MISTIPVTKHLFVYDYYLKKFLNMFPGDNLEDEVELGEEMLVFDSTLSDELFT